MGFLLGWFKIIQPIRSLNKNVRNTAQLKGEIEASASFEFILIF
ncbi:hypothetical protein HMPREF1405_01254 [Helicobacter pylori GAM231Ai]|nr:hypothetical protein HMPREF1405_01254 [Helicobacter pylori GAM231Ai]